MNLSGIIVIVLRGEDHVDPFRRGKRLRRLDQNGDVGDKAGSSRARVQSFRVRVGELGVFFRPDGVDPAGRADDLAEQARPVAGSGNQFGDAVAGLARRRGPGSPPGWRRRVDRGFARGDRARRWRRRRISAVAARSCGRRRRQARRARRARTAAAQSDSLSTISDQRPCGRDQASRQRAPRPPSPSAITSRDGAKIDQVGPEGVGGGAV